MPKFLQSSIGIGIGTLIYEFFARGLHQIKWGRVAFIVLFSMPIFWFFYRQKEKTAASQA